MSPGASHPELKLWEVVRFEVEYQLRKLTTPAFFLALATLTVFMSQELAEGPRHINSPLTVGSAAALMGLFAMLVTAALFIDAAMRDVAVGAHAIFYTEPITRLDYLGGRFLGALIVNVLVFLAIPIGLMTALVAPNVVGPETSLPFRAATYIEPFLLFNLPNLFVTAAILFTVAALTRRALPAYLIGLAIAIGYVLAVEAASEMALRIGGVKVAAFLDPFGILAIQEHLEHWTPAEKMVWPMGYPRIVVLNRFIWLSLSVLMLAYLHARFRFTLPRTKAVTTTEEVTASPLAGARDDIRVFARDDSVSRQVLAIARLDLREILLSKLFLGITLATVFLVATTAYEVGAAVFETSVWPVTHMIAGSVLTVQTSFILVLLIALYAGELHWRDRDAKMHEITAVAPVSAGATLAGHFIAIVATVVVLQVVMMLTGIALQASQGYYDFEPLLYARILFGIMLVDAALFGVLAMVVHVIVDEKYVGHLVMLLVYLFTQFAGVLRIRHHLLVYGSDPGWVYSDMNGFGPFVAPYVWFKLYWAAWALLLLVIASLFVTRGTDRGWRTRLRLARLRFAGRTALAAAGAAALVLGLGGFIFYNTNILNDYPSPGESEGRAADYERTYKRYEDAAQPRLVGTVMWVEIYPERSLVSLSGRHRLVNRTARPIDSIHLIDRRAVTTKAVKVDRPARLVLNDERHHYRIYDLDTPLQPGDSIAMSFDLVWERKGFPNDGVRTEVTSNGAYFDRRWLPMIGYQPALEIDDSTARSKQGLPPRRTMVAVDDSAGLRRRSDFRNEDLVDIDVTIGTAEDQVAVTPGRLIREWKENGRAYFHYRTDFPLTNGAPILSARYSVWHDSWLPPAGGPSVALKVYFHPTHRFNIERLIRSMKASLDYYTTQFGPYQFPELRIVEFPRYANFARAHPHTIAFSEGGSFLTRVEEGDVDRPYFVTAHEIAHQWWGGQMRGANVEGAALLSETLAQYSSMMVLEKTYGPEHVRRFYDFAMDYYLRGRGGASGPEVPLLRVGDQSWLYYQKGAVAMYTLRERIGEEAVSRALRRYLEKHRSAGPPYPTSLDLYAELRAVTPDSVQWLLRDLFETVTVWDLKTDSANVEKTATGEFRVTMHVTAAKVRTDSVGKETEVPMDELVDVGVYGPPAPGRARGEFLYLRQHRIRSGQQTITVSVAREPVIAGLDPLKRLIQRKGDDNLVKLSKEAAGTRR